MIIPCGWFKLSQISDSGCGANHDKGNDDHGHDDDHRADGWIARHWPRALRSDVRVAQWGVVVPGLAVRHMAMCNMWLTHIRTRHLRMTPC